jgi:hypothetical protein
LNAILGKAWSIVSVAVPRDIQEAKITEAVSIEKLEFDLVQ